MSICEQKSPLLIWEWDDPRLPLQIIKAKWVKGAPMEPHWIEMVRHNRDHNPDIRIREECRALLCAAAPGRSTSGTSSVLRRRANAAKIRSMVVQLP